ncbi:hypothetical protein NL676_029925 [Syzygium grande]|nr:hypothetical protein NL676_029925 [Syzygium grande]
MLDQGRAKKSRRSVASPHDGWGQKVAGKQPGGALATGGGSWRRRGRATGRRAVGGGDGRAVASPAGDRDGDGSRAAAGD